MIKLTRINGQEIIVNADLIEIIEHHTDTVISLTTGNKILVRESLDDIAKKVKEFRDKPSSKNV